jgi:uncharacterized protein YdaU (DUF1376 family)
VNYYEHHIGDYRKDTSHLSLLEHGIYRQLLDTYYIDEKPLTLDHAKLMRSHSVRSADEVQAFQNVLSDFFIRTEEGYVHKRCEAVIAAYKAKSVKAAESAKARWNKGKSEGSADAMRSHTEGNANHKPLTINQEPEDSPSENKRVPRFNARKHLASKGVEEQNINDWLEVRKKKGQANTLSAMELTESEAAKAGISLNDAIRFSAQRSYAGFKASWLQNEQSGERQNALDLAQQVQRSAGPRNPGGYVSKQEQIERNNRAVVERLAARLKAEEAAKGNDDETE